MKRRTLCLALSLSGSVVFLSCTDSTIEARERYWSRELADFFQEERHLGDLEQWLGEHGVETRLTEDDAGRSRITLETVSVSNLACAEWHFQLVLQWSASEVITSYALEQTGTCV